MKLLFDQNLSIALVGKLSDLFPGSVHVKQVGMSDAADDTVWEFAKANGYTIVSKDSDFQQRSLLFGAPPKVVWLRIGNCPTGKIADLLRKHSVELYTFDADTNGSLLALS